jgi:Amt family ammonium transporter
MMRRIVISLPCALCAMALCAAPATAADVVAAPVSAGSSAPLLLLAFLAPAGFALLAAAARPLERAWDVALSALLAFGVSVVVYFAAGFAFQFGSLGLWNAAAGFRGLNMGWSFVMGDAGRGWGMLGLRGFLLGGGAGSLDVYHLFLAQLPLATTAVMIPMLALRRRAPAAVTALAGLLMAGVVYPLLGNWAWGGGWLAQLGRTLNLGHGVVDLGGAGVVHLAGGAFALVGLILFTSARPARADDEPATLPAAHLPLLGVLGALLLPIGVWATLLAQTWPGGAALAPELMGVNLMLAAGPATLLPALYTWFVAGRPDPLQAARGLAAGLIAVSAGAPFIAPGGALAVGAVAGAFIPFATYLVGEKLRLDDESGAVVLHGLGGLIGLFAPALFALGQYGAGWNGLGAESYLGVAGQGVTGLWAAAGWQPDWPGQMQAQLAAAGADVALPVVIALLGLGACRIIGRAWRGSAGRQVEQPPESTDGQIVT